MYEETVEVVEEPITEEEPEETIEEDEETTEDNDYIYYYGVFGLSSYQSEEELKEYIPDACAPGEHNWQQSPDNEDLWMCECDARREAR